MANFVYTYSAAASEATVEIETYEPSTLVAPAQIWLRAINHSGLASFEETGLVYEGAFHEYHHEWTINGEPLSAFSRVANVLAEHNNPNKMFGQEVGFVLPAAGSYVIDLVVTDRLGNTATASTSTLTVVTPESFFPEADRIYVDNTGVHDGVPAASGKVQTLEALRTAMNSRNANPTWVLLKRGQEHTLDGVNPGGNENARGLLDFQSSNKVQMVSNYGDSEDPLPIITQSLDSTRFYSSGALGASNPLSEDWRTFSGIRIEGDYSPEDERGAWRHSYALFAGNWANDDGFMLFHNIETEGTAFGFGSVDSSNNIGANFRHIISDCLVDGYKDYGIFGTHPDQKLAIVGVGVVQKSLAMNKGAQDGFRNAHGPIRIPYGTLVLVSMCDILTRGAWDGNDQPCLRLFPSSDSGQHGYVDRCTMEGGFEVIHLRRSSQQVPAQPYNVVVERNLLVSSTYTQHHIHAQRSGLTVRDNLLIDTNVEKIVASGIAAINLSEDEYYPELGDNTDDPIVIHGNTYVNLQSGANDGTNRPNDFLVNEGDYYTNVTSENNVTHKAAGDITFTDFAPLDLATAISGVSMRYAGLRFGYTSIAITLDADYANGEIVEVPYSSFNQTLSDDTVLGGATDQAYWQAIEGANTRHQVRWVTGSNVPRRFYAESGDIAVTFTDATNVRIQNLTGLTWLNGDTLGIWLDRTTLLQSVDPTYANPATVPLPRPQTGSPDSPAIGTATAGRVSPKDFLLADRGATPSKGALEPAP